MKTLITGCSGLVGNALIENLFQKGHSIQCLKRNHSEESRSFWATGSLPSTTDPIFHSVVHLAGDNVATDRWTENKKKAILDSRIIGTRELVEYLSLQEIKPKVFLCASAVGFYGNRSDEILDENSTSGEGFLADVCRQWEREAQRLIPLGVRVVHLRFGMVMSPNGGALQKMAAPFRLGLGGIVGTGNQFISWISIRDLVNIVDFIIRNENIKGPVNVVSPIPATNREFTKTLGYVLGRPTILPLPAFAVKMVFGQMADEMLLTSARATPKVLLEADYQFKDQSLEAVMRACLK
jgi:uncharacterized protein (TIGR01777 family)